MALHMQGLTDRLWIPLLIALVGALGSSALTVKGFHLPWAIAVAIAVVVFATVVLVGRFLRTIASSIAKAMGFILEWRRSRREAAFDRLKALTNGFEASPEQYLSDQEVAAAEAALLPFEDRSRSEMVAETATCITSSFATVAPENLIVVHRASVIEELRQLLDTIESSGLRAAYRSQKT